MSSTLQTKSISRTMLLIFTLSLFFACQKDISNEDGGTVLTPPDLSTKISSSVSGFVTDENDAPVLGAIVQFGTSNITTDKYGYFEARNVQVVKEAAVVTVNRPGYFKGIKTYAAKEGKAAFFRIKLIPKTVAGSVNAASGGTVALSNGLSVKLPAGAIVNATTNAAYTGTVNVAAYWISPTAADLARIMPGDLRGINTEGSLKLLQTFGMAAVELTGTSGELLQIANGQKATLTLPIPSSLLASAPATIPLWYFDEAKGLWKEEGSAVKSGNTYMGEVSHFSFWNYDMPGNYVQFDCTLKNSAGNPIPFTTIKISVPGINNWAYGWTDSSGYVSGAVPANSTLLLEVFANYSCPTAIYSQTFATTNVNISLGVITVTATSNVAVLNGTVTSCADTAARNGYIILKEGLGFTRYPLNYSGAYSISGTFCSLPRNLTLIGEDITNTQQSTDVIYTVNAGTNTVPNIKACGITTQEFMNYTINSTPHSFTAPSDWFYYFNDNVFQNNIRLECSKLPWGSAFANIKMDNTGIGVGSSQNLQNFYQNLVTDTLRITTPISVNITEYGSVGQFTAGNFTGIFTGAPPANTQYNVNCNFRLKRTN